MPGSRALIGGLLVTVAAVATFVVATGATTDNRATYVVAAHDIAPGEQLKPGDMRPVRLALPAEVGGHAVTSSVGAAGAQVLGPLRAGELIQKGNIRPATDIQNRPEISFALPAARAVGGDIRSGESVDILVTDKADATTPARTVVAGAVVLRIDRGSSSSLGRNGEMTITVAVNDRQAASAVVGAVDQGQVTLVRAGASISGPAR